jgi:acetolactate synthase-1/2/3 large subunit
VSGLADVLVARLRAVGTRALFGVPGGGGNLDLIEAARRAGLPFVLTSTETGAAIAAIAQAEVTGRPGACLTTLGPGAASVVNGVACAYLDRAPIAVFTDNSPVGARQFSHQHLDQLAMFAPITKWSGQLTPGDNAGVIDRVFQELTSLPPGPVHLDCPGDAFGTAPVAHVAPAATRPLNQPESFSDREAVSKVAALVSGARKPLLIVGLGARQEADTAAIRHLCERLQVPAMVTYKAKGVVPDAHDCFAGVFTNGFIERALIDQSDLIIGVGLDPIELLPRPWTFAQPIVNVNTWTVPDDHVPFAAQWVTAIAPAMASVEGHMRPSDWDLDAVRRAVDEQRRRIDLPGDGLTSQRIVEVAARAMAATGRLTVDAGAHMLPATMLWPVAEPNGLLISNGLSTMGFALPAAIGAAMIERDAATETGARARPVVALIGDGGLLMCAGELLTAAREKLRIVTIVFSDASLSLIEIKQQARQLPPAGVALGHVKWAALAESVGVAGFVASTEDELAAAIDQAAACDGPSLIEARIDRSNYGAMLRAIRG